MFQRPNINHGDKAQRVDYPYSIFYWFQVNIDHSYKACCFSFAKTAISSQVHSPNIESCQLLIAQDLLSYTITYFEIVSVFLSYFTK